MILNDFLSFKLGVVFDDKYNDLAVKEVLSNKEMYPLIAEEIANAVDDADHTGKEWDFDSSFFDCDDWEFCADYSATMELYRAFVCAFAKDIKDKPITMDYVSFGLEYLKMPNTDCILDPYVNYNGMTYINLFPYKTELCREIYYPLPYEEDYLGNGSTEKYSRSYSEDNEELLQKIAEEVKRLLENGCDLNNHFDNEGLKKHPVELESDKIGYSYNCYEICIEENLLRFFSTEKGCDAFSVFRSLILESLDDEQCKNKVAKILESVY